MKQTTFSKPVLMGDVDLHNFFTIGENYAIYAITLLKNLFL